MYLICEHILYITFLNNSWINFLPLSEMVSIISIKHE